MKWLIDNFDKVITIFISVILAGIIGYYSNYIAIQSRINGIETTSMKKNHELEKKSIQKNYELEKNNLKKIHELELRIFSIEKDLSLLIKPKLQEISNKQSKTWSQTNLKQFEIK